MEEEIDILIQKCAENSAKNPEICKIKSVRKAMKKAASIVLAMGLVMTGGTGNYIVSAKEPVEVQEAKKDSETLKDENKILETKQKIEKLKQEYDEEIYPLNTDLFELDEKEAWNKLTDNLLDERPEVPDPENAPQIHDKLSKKMTKTKIKIRTWKGEEGLERKDETVVIEVNEELEDLWKNFFEDIYNEAPDFVISELYGYRQDKVGGGQVGVQSGHDYGAAFDINATQNPLNKEPLTEEEWKQLPETRGKYEEIYIGSKVKEIADRYTLSWGGDWISKKDNMHVSYIADNTRDFLKDKYGKAREEYIENQKMEFFKNVTGVIEDWAIEAGLVDYKLFFRDINNIIKEDKGILNTKEEKDIINKGNEEKGNDR